LELANLDFGFQKLGKPKSFWPLRILENAKRRFLQIAAAAGNPVEKN
jgi:hypothetical protein